MTRMCDSATRIWCCRILLVFSVLGVLCTMIFQIWSYYFSLVNQMDEQIIETPQVVGLVHACDDIRFSWNVKCSKGNASFLCEIQDTQDFDIGQGLSKYVGWSGKANITHNEDIISINSIQECVHVTIWAIPW